MRLILLFLRRFLFSRQSDVLFKATNYIIFFSLALGIGSLNIVISSINGFQNELDKKLANISGYFIIKHESKQYFQPVQFDLQDKNSIEPFLEGKILIKSKKNTQPALIQGYNTNALLKISFLKETIGPINDTNGIIIGDDLAENLNLSVGDKVIITTSENESPFKKDFFTISSIYNSGINEFDEFLIYSNLKTVQKLFSREDYLSGFTIFENKLISQMPDGLLLVSNKQKYRSLFEWLNAQKLPTIIIFGMIALVGFFNLIGSLNIQIFQKRKIIAILNSLGLSKNQLMSIFVYYSLLITLIGSIFGIFLSYVFIFLQNKLHFLKISGDIYFSIEYLPMEFNFMISVLLVMVSLMVAFLFTVYLIRRQLSFNLAKTLQL
jgi:lipoprotein-releasing system permease protein